MASDGPEPFRWNEASTAKKYDDAAKLVDPRPALRAERGVELVKTMATRKFDETVEATFRLGVDPKKAEQMIRGTVSLPHGTGKEVRVAVFAAGRPGA